MSGRKPRDCEVCGVSYVPTCTGQRTCSPEHGRQLRALAGYSWRQVIDDDVDVAAYLAWCRMSGFSETTTRNRRYDLNRLALVFEGRPLLDLGEADLLAWLDVESSRGLGRGTVAKNVASVTSFYRWAFKARRIAEDPTAALPRVRRPQGVPHPIAEARLRTALEEAPDAVLGAMLALACFGGLRAREVAGLAWPDVDLAATPPTLLVRLGKGGKTRVVPISAALRAYLEALPHREGPVIPRANGKPGHCKPHNISHRACRYLHGLGLPDTFHSLRHRLATRAYAASKDIRAVQVLLGHANLATTMVYVEVVGDAVAAAADGAGALG